MAPNLWVHLHGAPTVFLPFLKIIHLSVPLFLPRPEVVLILAPTLFSTVWRQWESNFYPNLMCAFQ